jgi:predicted ATPase/class 3 adenylate cyclase
MCVCFVLGQNWRVASRRTEQVAGVGLLSSDIEGSTGLLQQLGSGYAQVLLEHREIMRSAFGLSGGEEQSTEGDAFFVIFPSASAAVGAALAAQRGLEAHEWVAGVELRVRIGVHCGEIEVVAGTAVGMAVHEAARIAAAAHGGQVLASAELARSAVPLPVGASWRDLGEHSLKDIAAPVRLMQLDHPELQRRFPPLRAMPVGKANLPSPPTGFVGREAELGEVSGLIRQHRHVTLTGAGGSGKTRLALRAASEQVAYFPDGVWFVDLASIADSEAVPALFSDALRLNPDSAADLAAAIGSRQLLLLVDNCEHLVGPVSEVLESMLADCPNVVVLATSREPLGLGGEWTWRVPSLSDADAEHLFSDRARAANAHFELTDTNRHAVRSICSRLDAIPLALELAAARMGSLTADQLASRLNQRFRILTGGARRGIARQRTLQATVDWSFDLLNPAEQAVLRRLGVFVGDFSLEAAEDVCVPVPDDSDVLDLLDRLVSKSMVVAEEVEGLARYRLSETIRQYALDRLLQAGETEEARDSHLLWARRLVEVAEPSIWLGGDDEVVWLFRLTQEEHNLRAAFDWAVDSDRFNDASFLTIGSWCWLIAHPRLGMDWCERLLACGLTDADRAMIGWAALVIASNAIEGLDPSRLEEFATAIRALPESPRPWLVPPAQGLLALYSADHGLMEPSETLRACEAAVTAVRGGDSAILGMTLQNLVTARLMTGDLEGASDAANEALDIFNNARLSGGECRMAWMAAIVADRLGHFQRARELAERAIEVARRIDDTSIVWVGTQMLAETLTAQGDAHTAVAALVGLLHNLDDRLADPERAMLHCSIARAWLAVGDGAQAEFHARRALQLWPSHGVRCAPLYALGEAVRLSGNLEGANTYLLQAAAELSPGDYHLEAPVLEALAAVRLAVANPRNATILLAAASRAQTRVRGSIQSMTLIETARSQVDQLSFTRSWEQGLQLSFPEAIAVVANDTIVHPVT